MTHKITMLESKKQMDVKMNLKIMKKLMRPKNS